MKTRIVSTRIPAAQANGVFNISLPTGFGIPRGFLVYAMDNLVLPNNFDSNTDNPSYSVGFGGSNIAGTAITNVCTYLTNQEDSDPTVSRSAIGNTVSVFSSNNGLSISRQWSCTGFANDLILGTYSSVGTPQQSPLDLAFTVFGGDDVFCAIGQTLLPAVVNSIINVSTTFVPDAVLLQHQRNPTTTDGNIHFGCAIRTPGSGATTVSTQVGSTWRNTNNVGTTVCTARVSDQGTINLATNSVIRVAYMSSSGIAFTQSTLNAQNGIIFMALKAGNGVTNSFSAGTFQSATAIGTSFYAVGFKPVHILGGFTNAPSVNTNAADPSTNSECFSYFTANGFDESNITGIGTFTSSSSSTTLTGVGTSFLNQLGALDTIYNQNYQLVGIVSSITSNTSLLLSVNASITATGSSFVFEKPQQYSYSYGVQTSDGNGNANLRGYVSDNAFINFTATTPTLQTVGFMQNFDGSNGFTANYTTLGVTARFGWYLAIKDEDFYNRRRGEIS
jgi:hypothetical protein